MSRLCSCGAVITHPDADRCRACRDAAHDALGASGRVPRPYSIHSLDGGRVLVAVGLTLTPALRDRLIDLMPPAVYGGARVAPHPSRVEESALVTGQMGEARADAIQAIRITPSVPISEAEEIEIRSLLAAHAAEVIS